MEEAGGPRRGLRAGHLAERDEQPAAAAEQRLVGAALQQLEADLTRPVVDRAVEVGHRQVDRTHGSCGGNHYPGIVARWHEAVLDEHLFGDPERGVRGRQAGIERRVEDRLADLVRRQAVAGGRADVHRELPLGAHRDERGQRDEAALAAFEAGSRPDVAPGERVMNSWKRPVKSSSPRPRDRRARRRAPRGAPACPSGSCSITHLPGDGRAGPRCRRLGLLDVGEVAPRLETEARAGMPWAISAACEGGVAGRPPPRSRASAP